MSTPEITTRIDAPAPTDERAIDAAVASAVAVIEAAATLEQLKAARLAQTGDKSPLALANRAIATLENTGDSTSADRRALFRALRELDAGLLQTSTLSDLLTVRSREDPGPDCPLADMLWLLGSWLLGREQQPLLAISCPRAVCPDS